MDRLNRIKQEIIMLRDNHKNWNRLQKCLTSSYQVLEGIFHGKRSLKQPIGDVGV